MLPTYSPSPFFPCVVSITKPPTHLEKIREKSGSKNPGNRRKCVTALLDYTLVVLQHQTNADGAPKHVILLRAHVPLKNGEDTQASDVRSL